MISMTESASEKVKELLESEERQGHALRVFVRGMSCSGPAYSMALDDSTRPDDTIAEVFGVKLVVDPASAQYVEGGDFTTLDSVTEPDGEAHITVTRSLNATTTEQLELFLPKQDKTDREIVASAVQKRFDVGNGDATCSSLYIAKGFVSWSR